MSLENFKNRKLEWDTVNKNFDQSVQVISGDVNSRTVTIVITDNGEPIDLTGYSVKLVYKYIYNDSSGFVMLTPTDAEKGEFSLTIPTEMTSPGSIKSNLILLNENLEQVIVSKNLKFISDDSTVTDLAQEVNSKIDDFTKLLLSNMPQVMRSELNDLHAQTESNTSNIELKANSSDMTSLQSAMNSLQNKVEAFGITPENLVTIKSLLDAIANNATDSEVAELINSVNVLTSNISLMSDGDYSPKANKTDLESLQSTVNNQSAVISSKANQTEVIDMRTGSDGFTYTTAGDALRTIGKVVENSFKASLTLSTGYYINAKNGIVLQHTDQKFKATDYIDVSGVKTVKIDSKFSGSADGYAFYDINKKYISGSNIYVKEIAVPASARYFKFTALGLEDIAIRAFLIYDYNALMPTLSKLNNEQIPSKINNLVKLDFTLTNKHYIFAKNGKDTAIEDDNFWSTSYINVSTLSKVTINSSFSGYSDGYSFYDENKSFISGSNIYSSELAVPANAAFMRFTVCNIDITLASASGDFTFYKLSEKIESITSGVHVNAKPNYAFGIGKSLMIGDSLTSGAYYDDTYEGASINQNIPYYLGKMINEEVKNGGKSGWYPSNWYTNELPNNDVTQYDTFFIWLGTNKGLTDTLDADVNAYSDYNQFAATETGYYCRLIEYIKQHNPDAQIHLLTCFASGNLAETNLTIRNIATKYDLHVIDLIDLNMANHPELHLNSGYPHFGKAGNIYIANRIVQSVNAFYTSDPIKLEFGLTPRTN